MSFRGALDSDAIRLRVLLVAMVGICVILCFMLWKIQVTEGHLYEQNLDKQSIRRIRLPGMRGNIYDRNGQVLVENKPVYSIAVYIEELRQPRVNIIAATEDLIKRLAGILNLPVQVTKKDITNHYRKRLPLPLKAWKGLDEEAIARWAEQAAGIPGADIYWEGARVYPHGKTASHLLGYVGRADLSTQEEEPYHYYMPESEGKSGIEKKFDDILRGAAGGELIRVDVSGYKHDNLGGREPKAGKDVMLAIDLEIQQLAERVLAGYNGAAVVMDPRNGDVLALVSSPGFDPNSFIPSISQAVWSKLIEDENKPLLNRAVAGAYPPGSTFKPIVAMAALESHKSYPGQKYNCPGYFKLGKTRINCWYKPGHGQIVLRKALEQSCNVYFNELGLVCGHQTITHMASALGMGRKTGIDLHYERSGLVPDDAWKRRVYNDAWRDGDTCNLSIGQGALTVTPIQMGVTVSALANGGYVYRPRLVLGTREHGEPSFQLNAPRLVNNMNWSASALNVVRGGMRDVVMAPSGTGRRAAVPGVEMAGKTGTAEYGRKGSGLKYGWMIAFAPYDQPRYAVAIVVEKALSGGVTVAPLINQIMSGIFNPAHPEGGAG